MFGHQTCEHPSCNNTALHLSEYCSRHLADKQSYIEKISAFINENTEFYGLNLSGITVSKLDFSQKSIRFCNFSHSEFTQCNFVKSSLYMVFADFSVFKSCDFSHSSMKWTVLSGSLMEDCNFLESDLVRSAFVQVFQHGRGVF
jgi:uncharacterized protein YjbI with pentapeptide repeats